MLYSKNSSQTKLSNEVVHYHLRLIMHKEIICIPSRSSYKSKQFLIIRTKPLPISKCSFTRKSYCYVSTYIGYNVYKEQTEHSPAQPDKQSTYWTSFDFFAIIIKKVI